MVSGSVTRKPKIFDQKEQMDVAREISGMVVANLNPNHGMTGKSGNICHQRREEFHQHELLERRDDLSEWL